MTPAPPTGRWSVSRASPLRPQRRGKGEPEDQPAGGPGEGRLPSRGGQAPAGAGRGRQRPAGDRGGHDAADAKAGQTAEANQRFTLVLNSLNQYWHLPEELKQLTDARAKTLSQLEGKWGMGNCKNPSTWTVKDNTLQVYWAEVGFVEERIVNVSGNDITTVIQSPASKKGSYYRYTPDGARLDVGGSG